MSIVLRYTVRGLATQTVQDKFYSMRTGSGDKMNDYPRQNPGY